MYKKLIHYLNWFYFQLEDNNLDNDIYELKIKITIILLKSNELNIDYNDIINNFDYEFNKNIFEYLKDHKLIKKINLYYERLRDIKNRLCKEKEKTKIDILDIILDYLGNISDNKYKSFFKEYLNNYFKDIDDFIYKIYDYNSNFDEFYKFIIFNPIFTKKDNKYKKKSIPKSLKIKVWNTYVGEDIGKIKCLCCDTIDITQSIFECGHIIAEAKGGETSLENLRPICSTCNKSMKTINMNDYIKIINK
jgi:hypothetical protein